MVLATMREVGPKTQTRRIVKIPAGYKAPVTRHWNEAHYDGGLTQLVARGIGPDYKLTCPYGKPGDQLRAKEAVWMWCERRPNGTTPTGRQKWWYVPMREAGVFYAADHPKKPDIKVVSPETGNQWGWRLKIGRFMPAWASRITLEIVSVRVERLQDISEDDAMAEGITCEDVIVGAHYANGHIEERADRYFFDGCDDEGFESACDAYTALWEHLNGVGSWDLNPFVWCIEFKRLAQ